ncbi:MAG: hypothetical protein ACK4OP_13475 [Gemmobacter sp.]
MRRPTVFAILVLLAACSALPPDLDGAETAAARTAPYPQLVPIDPLLAAETAGTASAADTAAVEARAARLTARAAALRRIPAPGG